MTRCSRCLMPDTRPDIRFTDGVCSACLAYERRPLTDWAERRETFLRLIRENRTHPVYDCVIGSSGGKDSHYITLKALELGLRPLVVTALPEWLTAIGRRNIENLKSLGVDAIEFTADPLVRKKVMRAALQEVGDIEWGEHCLIFGVPVRIAQAFGIKIVLYGENPQQEYSFGREGAQEAVRLDRRWREEFGGLVGLRPADLVGREGITEAQMWPYEWPADSAITSYGLWLGQFFEWHGLCNALVAQAHGFEWYPRGVEGSIGGFENLDNAIVGIHDRFMWLKFGFGRATSVASTLIRRGILTREDALKIVRGRDGQGRHQYLGVHLGEILRAIDMDYVEYERTEDRFANTAILEKGEGGDWRLKE